MKIFKYFLLIIFTCFTGNLSAQEDATIEADGAFSNEAYFSAVSLYKKAYSKEHDRTHKIAIIYKIARSYHMVQDFAQAEVWYDKAIKAKHPDKDVQLYFAEVIQAQGKYDEALAQYNKFNAKNPNDERGLEGAKWCKIGQEWDNNPTDYEIENVKLLNSKNMDFAPTWGSKKHDEMIFSIQNTGINGLGSTTQFFCGTRSSFGSCWNTYLVSPKVVDLFENTDGSKFSWDGIIPGFSTMTPQARQIYFMRDNLTPTELTARSKLGADVTKYLATGNETRLMKAYTNRDPRLNSSVIIPYTSYNGIIGTSAAPVYSRFPFRSDVSGGDLRTDTQAEFYYLHRKFVYEGTTELLNRSFGPIDFPLIRYADVLLMWAEALNEIGDVAGALSKVNEVRARVKMPALQQTDATKPTHVISQTAARDRIRNERRYEFINEGVNYFDEIRWRTWKTSVFTNNGLQSVWGQRNTTYTWGGDHFYVWPIPQSEIQINNKLTQNPGWPN